MALSTFTLAFSPDGQVLASGGADRLIYLWDTKTWKVLRTLTGQAEMVTGLIFSQDGKTLMSGGSSEFSGKRPAQVHLWDVASGEMKRSVPSPHRVAAVAFAPDGKTVAVSDRGKEINIWAVPDAGSR
jgi:WD40 repeat protein